VGCSRQRSTEALREGMLYPRAFMSDTRKSRQPGLEPARAQKDPRVDSTPPTPLDEAPLAHLQHVAHTFSRPASAPRLERLASLEAEVERLRSELANDAYD